MREEQRPENPQQRYDEARKRRRKSAASNSAADNGGSAEGAGNAIDDAAELEKLARMAPLDYERARKAAAERLGIKRLSLLDSLVKAKRAELGLDGGNNGQGRAIEFPAPEPWGESVDGAALLNALA
jgi:putative DNA primase/helicase